MFLLFKSFCTMQGKNNPVIWPVHKSRYMMAQPSEHPPPPPNRKAKAKQKLCLELCFKGGNMGNKKGLNTKWGVEGAAETNKPRYAKGGKDAKKGWVLVGGLKV